MIPLDVVRSIAHRMREDEKPCQVEKNTDVSCREAEPYGPYTWCTNCTQIKAREALEQYVALIEGLKL